MGQITTTAKQPHPWAFIHDEIGWNYRLPNLNAALGLAQLEELNGFIAAKRALAGRYAAAFADLPGVTFVSDVNKAEFVSAMKPVWDKFAPTPELKALVQEIVNTK